MEGYWKGHGLFLRAGRSSLSLSEGKKLLILSLLCAAGVVSVSLAVSSSRSCGLMMEFRALDHCQPIGDIVEHGQACWSPLIFYTGPLQFTKHFVKDGPVVLKNNTCLYLWITSVLEVSFFVWGSQTVLAY